MANITVTHTFVNGTPADATEVNTNFSDIIAGTSDGTKDFSISALTVAGTANFSAAVNLNGPTTTLGNAVTDNIVFTGRVASDFDPITTATYSFGSTSLTWKDLYLDNGATDGGAIYFNASASSFIKSDAAGTDLDISGFTNLDLNGLAITGAAGASFDGAVVINESGADVDFRVEGDTVTNLLFVDASTDRIGFGTSTPSRALEIVNSAGAYISLFENVASPTAGIFIRNSSENIHQIFNEVTANATYTGTAGQDLIIKTSGGGRAIHFGQGTTHIMALDDAKVGIATLTPSDTLHVNGGLRLQNGSTSINYYEEGTWTPAFANPGSGSAVEQFGVYTRIGRIVHIYGKIRYSGITGGGAMSITGLPFSPAAVGDTTQRASAKIEGDWSGLVSSTNVATLMFRTASGATLQGVVDSSGASALAYHGTHDNNAPEFGFSLTFYV